MTRKTCWVNSLQYRMYYHDQAAPGGRPDIFAPVALWHDVPWSLVGLEVREIITSSLLRSLPAQEHLLPAFRPLSGRLVYIISQSPLLLRLERFPGSMHTRPFISIA
jgi:hypothetical protein